MRQVVARESFLPPLPCEKQWSPSYVSYTVYGFEEKHCPVQHVIEIVYTTIGADNL